MHNPEVTDPFKVVTMAAELERQLAVVKPMMSEKKVYFESSSDKNESSSQGEQQSTEHWQLNKKALLALSIEKTNQTHIQTRKKTIALFKEFSLNNYLAARPKY